MKSSDISLSLTIILLFILLLFINILLIGKKNIQNNWDVYKCNPMILAFAGQFLNNDLGAKINPPIYSATDEFTADQKRKFASASIQICIESIGGSVMKEIQSPIDNILDTVLSIGKSIVDAFMFALSFFNIIKQFIVGMTDSIFKIITSSYLAMMLYSQKGQGILSRYITTMQTMLNILNVGTNSVTSIYNNWPVEKIFKTVRDIDQLPVPSARFLNLGWDTKRTEEARKE